MVVAILLGAILLGRSRAVLTGRVWWNRGGFSGNTKREGADMVGQNFYHDDRSARPQQGPALDFLSSPSRGQFGSGALRHGSHESQSPGSFSPITPALGEDRSGGFLQHQVDLRRLGQEWRTNLLRTSQERLLTVTQIRGRTVNGVPHDADLVRVGIKSAPACLLLASSGKGLESLLTARLYEAIIQRVSLVFDDVTLVLLHTPTMDAPPWPRTHLHVSSNPVRERAWSDATLAQAEARFQMRRAESIPSLQRHRWSENPTWDESSIETIYRGHLMAAKTLVHIDFRVGINASSQVVMLSNNDPQSPQFTTARRMFSEHPCSESIYPVHAARDIDPVCGPAVLAQSVADCVSITVEFGTHDLFRLTKVIAQEHGNYVRRLMGACVRDDDWLDHVCAQAVSITSDALAYLGRPNERTTHV